MKRKTNTLDAEYKRRGLMRPTPAIKAGIAARRNGATGFYANEERVQFFDWRGTRVWGVKA